MNDKIVLAVILNYKSTDKVIVCIDSVLAQMITNIRLVVVDNDSHDGGFERLCCLYGDYENIVIVQSGNNCGYAAGNNVGIRAGMERWSVKYLLILNADIVLRDHSVVGRLVECLEGNPVIAGVQPKIVNIDGFLQGPYSRPSLYWEIFSRLMPIIRAVKIYRDRSRADVVEEGAYCYRVMGSCFLVRAEDMAQVGFFDENTFLYFEENILAEKIHSLGKRFYYLPSVSVIHDHPQEGVPSRELCHEYKKSMTYYYSVYRQETWIFVTVMGWLYDLEILLLRHLKRGR